MVKKYSLLKVRSDFPNTLYGTIIPRDRCYVNIEFLSPSYRPYLHHAASHSLDTRDCIRDLCGHFCLKLVPKKIIFF
jgi:hypothetical protein